jgi:hypothetical protein
MKRKLPRFRSEREEAAFWDTHDSTDYAAELEDDSETVIEVGRGTWTRLVREAKKRRTTPNALVRRWLKDIGVG